MSSSRPILAGKYFTTPSGYSIHYHEAGERSAGKPNVLLLHGNGPGASGNSNVKYNFPAFAEAGYHCLMIDCPGYGYSSEPTDIDYSTDFYVGQLHELVTGLGITQVLPLGNSLLGRGNDAGSSGAGRSGCRDITGYW